MEGGGVQDDRIANYVQLYKHARYIKWTGPLGPTVKPYEYCKFVYPV